MVTFRAISEIHARSLSGERAEPARSSARTLTSCTMSRTTSAGVFRGTFARTTWRMRSCVGSRARNAESARRETPGAGGAAAGEGVSYHAQCDNYDRIGGVFFVREPAGQTPVPTDPRTELIRFITPFSDYMQRALATHVYPDADSSAYAQVLADPTHDVWIGIGGGSNPYSMDPCVATNQAADFQAVGFKYSLDFVSTAPLAVAPSTVFPAVAAGDAGGVPIAEVDELATPVAGTFVSSGSSPLTGHVTVIVSGHGSAAGGDEYESTDDTVSVGGKQVGLFSTHIDCAPFASASPDGNQGIFQNNGSGNPRNWCPGALVPSHTFAVTLAPGNTPVELTVSPAQVPSGSYYDTSITFSAP